MPNHMNLIRPRLLTIATLLASSLWLAPARADDQSAKTADAAGSIVIGTGLVIGLPGTGDSAVDEGLVEKSIVGVLRHAGLDPWKGEIVSGRVAKVVVTAELPPDAPQGAPLTIKLTMVGDATSLAGGTLLAAPLRDPDGKLYAIGQGPVAVEHEVATAAGRSEQSQDAASEVAMVQGTVAVGGRVRDVAAE